MANARELVFSHAGFGRQFPTLRLLLIHQTVVVHSGSGAGSFLAPGDDGSDVYLPAAAIRRIVGTLMHRHAVSDPGADGIAGPASHHRELRKGHVSPTRHRTIISFAVVDSHIIQADGSGWLIIGDTASDIFRCRTSEHQTFRSGGFAGAATAALRRRAGKANTSSWSGTEYRGGICVDGILGMASIITTDFEERDIVEDGWRVAAGHRGVRNCRKSRMTTVYIAAARHANLGGWRMEGAGEQARCHGPKP
ncbi:hypothetical protein CHU95_20090 [Niveispirillum lacus]|uniref:Uncharacterized protein n=1 Tax=Niveispirillum lacus TaxID=1981099 RepID=A0A255YRV0_9PROT|nr:hypothetical protein CHU95_20090 [Niveispirillum lacus]